MNDKEETIDPKMFGRRIIERLKMFNRKERDHLMKFALCEKPEAPILSDKLWAVIQKGGDKPHAEEMFVGMDYHLNWLYAALATVGKADSELKNKHENTWHEDVRADSKNKRPIKRSQEDVDLLIAWVDPDPAHVLHLVLIEAKLDSSWGSKQFKSKRKRLTLIREDAEARKLNFIDWRFLLISPRDAPKKNEFNLGKTPERYRWLLKRGSGGGASELWHESLPIGSDLIRVGRKKDSGEEWTTTVSLRMKSPDDSSQN